MLANIDDGPTKDALIAAGLAEQRLPREALYDLLLDPNETDNLVGDPASAADLGTLRTRLDDWMRTTSDPLLDGPVPPVPGARINTPDQRSASESAVSLVS